MTIIYFIFPNFEMMLSIYILIRKMQLLQLNNMKGPGYLVVFSQMLMDTDNKVVRARGRGGRGLAGEGQSGVEG